MKDKKGFFIFIPIVLPIIFFGFYSFSKQNKDTNKVGKQEAIMNSIENVNIPTYNEIPDKVQEVDLATFSTPLAGDENRLENIRISCDTINGTTLNNVKLFPLTI